jgi:hypothetical protein
MRWALVVCVILVGSHAASGAQYTDSVLGFSFSYPDSWHVKTWHRGEVTVRNFPDDEAIQGGDPPKGGTQIEVNVFPPYPPWWPADTDEYERLHGWGLHGTIISETARQSGLPARVKYEDAPFTRVESVLKPSGTGRTFEAMLEYWTSDQAGPEYERIFENLLASLSVLPSVTPPARLLIWYLLVPPELFVPNPAAGKDKPECALWGPQIGPPPPSEPTPKVAPYLLRRVDTNAPLRMWQQRGEFDSEAECKAAIPVRKRENARDKRVLVQLRHARCIEEGDFESRIEKEPIHPLPPNSN